MRTLSLTISPGMARKSVKAVLRQELQMANGLISRIKLRETGILLNGIRVKTSQAVQSGDILTVEIGDLPSKKPEDPVNIPLDILWEDDDLLIINKPAGMAVHGSHAPGKKPTLANALAYYWGSEKIFHPVSRLDRGTSGIMTIAKNSYVHDRMRTCLHTQNFEREYRGIAWGKVNPPAGKIQLPIGRAPDSIIRRQICEDGRPAETFYETLQATENFTLLKLQPQTGRTHQLRLHMAALGFPLAGDWLYGKETPEIITHPALHSYKLRFLHPITQEMISLCAPLPADMLRLLDKNFTL